MDGNFFYVLVTGVTLSWDIFTYLTPLYTNFGLT